ncbi:Hypothetical predicted protein [Mytilus galloprovincialis]|uniref:Uncharacterized protein n=1 Tax=Mytilus galloprovincialis TaxID=29158 RepID=A0A8B6FZQ6_MYTGA|nr:Hypothetical predicted protein [Mytilus galloprovincialis]
MLRHFEWINPPRKGWGNEIEDADIELADDIERIRQISNTVILMPLHQVSEIVYSSVMQKVKEISVRIASFKKESNRSKESIYSCEIGNKETLEEDEISTLLNNLRKMHEIKTQEQARFGTTIANSNVEQHIMKDVTNLLCRIAEKTDRIINNSTTNLAESWMHIRTKFDGGKVHNHCNRGSWHARFYGGAQRMN